MVEVVLGEIVEVDARTEILWPALRSPAATLQILKMPPPPRKMGWASRALHPPFLADLARKVKHCRTTAPIRDVRASEPRRPKSRAIFIEPMLLLRTDQLPEGARWTYELKLDGYRAIAIKSSGKVQLRSRNNKDFSARYPLLVIALSAMPDETVLDGEIVAIDEEGSRRFTFCKIMPHRTCPESRRRP